jgi:hypothetical protein
VNLQTAAEGDCPLDIRLLRRFGTAQQQDDKFQATAREINPIARAEMDSRLEHTAPDCLAVADVSIGHSLNGHEHTGLGAKIRQANQAFSKRAGVDYLQATP